MNGTAVDNRSTAPDEAVRNKAYELWQARGNRHGQYHEDWYIAEMLVQLETKLRTHLDAPAYRQVSPSEILREVQVSHTGIDDFFAPQNSWIEADIDVETVFELDRNRRLHFDEGFLAASQRVAGDASIELIAATDHFPYRDLPAMRQKVARFASLYESGASFPPPLFFYPSAYQLEILDGVHRCLAASHALKNLELKFFRIWVGFGKEMFYPSEVVQQLWSCSVRHLHNSERLRC